MPIKDAMETNWIWRFSAGPECHAADGRARYEYIRLPFARSPVKIHLMKRLLLFFALPVFAADPAGFKVWTNAEVTNGLHAAKLDAHKIGVDRLGEYGNHGVLAIRREGDGEAEVHDGTVDVIFVTSGEGTLVVGGTVVSPHTTSPGEIRGPSITGGVSKKMMPGDIFHIPANVPHQMLVPKLLTFEVVKVKTK